MLERLWKLRRMPWYYRRPVTTGAVATVAVLGTFLARALMPRSWRPTGSGWLIVGSAGAYAALRLGSYSGLSKRFKHTFLDWFGGDVDDAQTWMLAGLGGGSTLVLGQLVQRKLASHRVQALGQISRPQLSGTTHMQRSVGRRPTTGCLRSPSGFRPGRRG